MRIGVAYCLVVMLGCGGGAGPTQPEVCPPSSVKKHISSLPKYTRFGFSGLAFQGEKLFATGNIGVLEIEKGEVTALYRWRSNDAVVEGPWNAKSLRTLVFQEAATGNLLFLKENSWTRYPLPKPSSGEFSRGAMLNGFVGYSNDQAFWLVGGGQAWRFTGSAWVPESLPTSEEGVMGLLPLKDALMAVLRHDPDTLGKSGEDPKDEWLKSDTIQRFAADGWKEVSRDSEKFFAKRLVSLEREGFILTRAGTVLRVTSAGIVQLESPGPCEAIATTTQGKLIGSFRNKGIYEYGSSWALKYKCPYPPDEGEHWAYLAEGNGVVAFATTSIPKLSGGFTGTTMLWYSKGGVLEKVPYEK